MGQLDEAIRAHLELKRKHGASDEEVHAEEQEALGPVRREPSGPASPEAEEAVEPQFALDDEAEDLAEPPLDPGVEEPLSSEAFAVPEEAYLEPEDPYLEPEGVHEPADPITEPTGAEPTVEPMPAEPGETAQLAEGEAPVEPPAGDTPARGFPAVEEADGERSAGEAEDEEDVLEETPEFLQETPEHDRLWFEQKPPRDFDFDE